MNTFPLTLKEALTILFGTLVKGKQEPILIKMILTEYCLPLYRATNDHTPSNVKLERF